MWGVFCTSGFYGRLELAVFTSGIHKMGMMCPSCLTAKKLSSLLSWFWLG